MSLLEKIKEDSLAARKNRDTAKAVLLTTLYSEAANVGKNNGNRDSTDAEVVAVVKKFLKGVDETIVHLKNDEMTEDRYTALEAARNEQAILVSYMPVQLTELDLQKIVGQIVSALPTRDPKQVGTVMKQLKAKYEGLYDGALASKVIKAVLDAN